MNEQEITFRHGGLTFAATLALPEGEGPFPAVLMIPGSGPLDRNEDAKRAPLGVFRTLAQRFAAMGVASLRYDKRGVGRSEGDFWSCGFHQARGDAGAAFAALRARPEVEQEALFLLGHSEGALQAARLAAEGLPVAGVVLLAGTARSGEECLLWQGRAIAGTMRGLNGWLVRTFRIDANKQQRKVFAKLRRTSKDVVRLRLLVKMNARWFREFMDHDPSGDIARLQVPTLAVTGEADVQTPPEDLERMRALNPDHVETVLVPGLSHVLRHTEGGGLSDYKRQLAAPIAPELFEALERWLADRLSVEGRGRRGNRPARATESRLGGDLDGDGRRAR